MGYFEDLKEIKYEGVNSMNPFAFKFYDKDKIIDGKPMKEHLKFAMSWWHTLNAGGSDPFGEATIDRTYGAESELDRAFKRVDAGFEFMQKLGIEYFCFHDLDIAPEGKSFKEFRDNLNKIVDYIAVKMQETGIKLLWGTANLFTNKRYMHGAGTSSQAESFAYAAAQIKNAIDATIRLGGKGYVFWGGREGYETLLNTDMGFELDNLARLLKLSVKYAREKGFKGDFYIEPKPKEPTKHQYDFDASTVLAFLRKYDLIADFKLNIEANHATLAGHTFAHELAVARINGAFGSIDANIGDSLLGWDTDQFPTDVKDATYAMMELIRNGGFTNGGLNFDAKVRRASFTYEDIAMAYISGMDTMALAFEKAREILNDDRYRNFMADRYSSYEIGIGKKIVDNELSLEDLEKYISENDTYELKSGGQEYLEMLVNQILYR